MKTIEKIKKAYANVIMTKGEALKLSKRIIIAEIEIGTDESETELLVSALEKISIKCFDNSDNLGELDIEFDFLNCIDIEYIHNVIISLMCIAERENER